MHIRILKNSEISFIKEMLYDAIFVPEGIEKPPKSIISDPSLACLLYTSDAADERSSVDLGGRRIIKKKKKVNI